ncbi:Hsp20/alpha crystallin family protein [Bacillus mesophilum]|uniref:Hsp20/alpha crystallin family protein n=1 Tax=Bacillus mesophilum TaxID=1071718 RepID=A0A7V7UVZ5_9BACI|nr:Hsp20/alpha crystallin family protein [Bacillus mesophilum]KAB2333641.1 Hsp20/alpha crystallin family protein [Bacillus mesophilum]
MSDDKKKVRNEPFGDIMKSMNQCFHEKPVRGFMQTMDDFFKNPFPAAHFHVEVSETDDAHIISAELPGINKEQIQLDVLDNYITITINQLESLTEEDENRQITRRHQSFQRSSRTIPLPQPINEKKVKANYKNGLLQIKVPKQKGKTIFLED